MRVPSMWAAGAIGAFAGFLHAYQLSAGAPLLRRATLPCVTFPHRLTPICTPPGRLMGRFENAAEAKAAGLSR